MVLECGCKERAKCHQSRTPRELLYSTVLSLGVTAILLSSIVGNLVYIILCQSGIAR